MCPALIDFSSLLAGEGRERTNEVAHVCQRSDSTSPPPLAAAPHGGEGNWSRA
jgi:hypothetical protein